MESRVILGKSGKLCTVHILGNSHVHIIIYLACIPAVTAKQIFDYSPELGHRGPCIPTDGIRRLIGVVDRVRINIRRSARYEF